MGNAAERVLDALRDAGAGRCSGAELSSRLGVSRAQVWKHVGALRARGYGIDGEPGGGYRLTSLPDRLYEEEIRCALGTGWLAREIRYFESTDSTNRVAQDWAREGAPHGATVVAEQQSAGRGRLGRSFHSPAFENLYTSIVLRPRITTSDAPTLILAAGLAVAECIARTLEGLPACATQSDDVEIKWPNDVLLGGLKTSGILMELAAEATRVDFAILGIGINLNVARETFPDEFRDRATSLRSHSGQKIDRAAFAGRLYDTLEEVLEAHAHGGFDAIRDRFFARFRMRGQHVRVIEMGERELEGRALGIAPDGALELEDADGRVHRVVAGDVTLAKRGDPKSEEMKRS
jgi:BirA family biotin operon repressor/biotin-[acetyl-CoA-carboxylase] ligase